MELNPCCPYCNGEAECEYVDIGVGLQQCSPFVCSDCGSVQMNPYDDNSRATEGERYFGWWFHPEHPEQSKPDIMMRTQFKMREDIRKRDNRNRLEKIE